MAETPRTWQYGLVARWWAEFSEDGPKIAYLQKYVEQGQPALDVACGTGRLLIPYLRAGLDVDGCDVSADMIELCREKAEREGLSPTLFVQPMHELDPPRSYRTIFVCGGPAPSCSTTRTRTPAAIPGAPGGKRSAPISLGLASRSPAPSDAAAPMEPSTRWPPGSSTSTRSSR